MKIYNLGSMNTDYVYTVDHTVTTGETLASSKRSVFPGGKGLNQSIALARAGVSVIHGGILGDDGDFLKETLAVSGADVSRILCVRGDGGHAVIQVDAHGQNSILVFAGSNHLVDGAYARRFLFDAEPGDILVLQNEISGLRDIFEIAHEKQLQIAFNPSPYHEDLRALPLSYVTWWFCNEIEGNALFGGDTPQQIAAHCMASYPHSRLILTLGSDGSLYRDAHTSLRQPIYPTVAVDTTAAGDTFTGYVLAAIVNGDDIATALRLASKAASLAVSKAGASSSIPYRRDIEL